MKKLNLLSSLVSLVFLLVSFVTVVNAEPYSYTGDKPIYPAVYQAIISGNKSNWSGSYPTLSDPNTVIIERVVVSDGLKLAQFTLKISLENNVVTYKFSNIMEKLPVGKSSDWAPVDKFMQSDRESIFTSYFDKEIPKVMEDEALYAKAKATADKVFGIYSFALKNPQNYLIYPAVGAAFNNLKQTLGNNAQLYNINCLDNEFIIRDCVAAIRNQNDINNYRIKITCKENQLSVEFTNIEPISKTDLLLYTDKDIKSISKYDTQKISDQLKTQIEKTLATEDAYKAAKKAFLEDNTFLYRSISSVNSMLIDEFVTKIFKDGEISFNASVTDVKKNENVAFKDYTMEISASLRTERSSDYIFLTLYTSDSALARLKSGDKIKLSGNVVNLERKMTVYLITMTK